MRCSSVKCELFYYFHYSIFYFILLWILNSKKVRNFATKLLNLDKIWKKISETFMLIKFNDALSLEEKLKQRDKLSRPGTRNGFENSGADSE